MADKIGKINLVETMNKKINDLYKSSKCSDVVLVVGDTRIFAHKSIIGAQCDFFENLFSSPLNEPHTTEFVLDVPLEAFEIILKYFYTGQINLVQINDTQILIQLINLVEEYCLFFLKPYFENYCSEILSVENACLLLAIAKRYKLEKLENKSFNFIEKKSDEILASESFKTISQELLEDILKRETFYASSELHVFNAVSEWSTQENRNIETVIHLINLPLIPSGEVIKIANLGTLTERKLWDTIKAQTTINPIKRAGIRKPNTNVASPEYYAKTIQGFMAAELLNDNSTSYDEIKGYTRHTISKANDTGIIVELGNIFSINHLKMLLWDADNRSYSYFIEISTDMLKWDRIIDYSSYSCRSWQGLVFLAKNVKYIKIVGTHCTKNSYFDVVSLKAYYIKNIPQIKDGFLVPQTNVASAKLGATVLEGEGNPDKNGLINGDHNNGYTSHSFGAGKCILIQLSQPYHINSIRLLLDQRGCNSLKYKFYIAISLNNRDWEEVVNHRDEFVNSWKTFNFPSKPVLFIKIVGTASSQLGIIDNRLQILHFESPSKFTSLGSF